MLEIDPKIAWGLTIAAFVVFFGLAFYLAYKQVNEE